MEQAILAGGCFWCIEALFKEIKGVETVVSGYCGGKTDNPSYQQLHDEETGHAEAIQITFDPQIISYKELLEIFYAVHDPTTPNQQGNDIGPEYRSAIFYVDDDQKEVAKDVTHNFAAKHWDNPIVTEIVRLEKFWPAEDYHQDFYAKNPEQGYCRVIINPKLTKFRQHFADRLKSS